VKNWRKTIVIEGKLRRNKPTQKKVNVLLACCNVRLADSSVCTICDNANKITESVKSGTKVFVYQDYHSPIAMNHTKNFGYKSLMFLLH
jgi:hypothetical protein